ncbi:MAG: YdcF family protein [Terracidiphilus sp.]
MAIASSTRQTGRRAPSRRPRRRYKPIELGQKPWILRASLATFSLVVIWAGWALIERRLAPTGNTSRDHFDAILVLGTPADADGNPTPKQQARVTEAVREYERGVAPRILFTGGAAHNQFVEADVMAGTAAARGIPPSAIFVETKAMDTIQNACNSARIMQAHGWHSAEIVTGGYQLPRAGMIFANSPLDWRLHAAPPLQPGASVSGTDSAIEILKTMRYLIYASWAERCES